MLFETITSMKKTVEEIRDELLLIFLKLEESYLTYPGVEDGDVKAIHLNVEICETLLNSIRSLEYMFRSDVPDLRTKKRCHDILVSADKVLKKYGELSDPKNKDSYIHLKSKYDESGYIENREWFSDIIPSRKPLKRKR